MSPAAAMMRKISISSYADASSISVCRMRFCARRSALTPSSAMRALSIMAIPRPIRSAPTPPAVNAERASRRRSSIFGCTISVFQRSTSDDSDRSLGSRMTTNLAMSRREATLMAKRRSPSVNGSSTSWRPVSTKPRCAATIVAMAVPSRSVMSSARWSRRSSTTRAVSRSCCCSAVICAVQTQAIVTIAPMMPRWAARGIDRQTDSGVRRGGATGSSRGVVMVTVAKAVRVNAPSPAAPQATRV